MLNLFEVTVFHVISNTERLSANSADVYLIIKQMKKSISLFSLCSSLFAFSFIFPYYALFSLPGQSLFVLALPTDNITMSYKIEASLKFRATLPTTDFYALILITARIFKAERLKAICETLFGFD